jgi:hypothetical protein
MDDSGPGGRGRRAFTREAALALLAGVAVSVSGCGAGEPPAAPDPAPLEPPTPPPTPAPPPLTDKTGVFLANHRHEAVITAVQLMAGGGLLLDIRGAANHPHILELSAGEMTAIARGEEVAKESTEVKGHTHHVTFNTRPSAG